jgi:signal transduction histidine kinase
VDVGPDRVSLLGLRVSRWLSDRQLDWLVFAATFGLALPAVVHAARTGKLGVSLAVLPFATIPLLWRRRHPAAVLAVLACALAVSSVVGRAAPGNVGIVFAFYAAARYGGTRLRMVSGAIAAIATIVAFVMLLVSNRGRLVPHVTVALVFGAGGAWVLGEASRTRRAYLDELEDRATRLERDRDEHARRAAEEERIRIARELHDVVTHHVSVIAVQAGAAHSTSRSRPERALDALAVIERTARSTLGELRALLGVLRAGDGPEVLAPLTPTPSLAQLDELVARARAAGVAVELEVHGERAPLDAVVDMSAFRVLQEALTNVLKHAPGATARVSVRYEPLALHVGVVDDGPGVTVAASGGHGLVGMRERVELVGGELEFGSGSDGGFRVAARLPLARVTSRQPEVASTDTVLSA